MAGTNTASEAVFNQVDEMIERLLQQERAKAGTYERFVLMKVCTEKTIF